MSNKNYYLLETDDMVIALENKDAAIKELKELLEECRETIENAWMYSGIATPDAEAILTKITNAIGEKKCR